MSREVRRVPANWKHPRDSRESYIPLCDNFFEEIARWNAEAEKWEQGLYSDTYGNETWKPKTADMTGTFEEWNGHRPEKRNYMPDWPVPGVWPMADGSSVDWLMARRTHYQMYETCTEGTPISPVMATPEELARWLADNRASACGDETATYEQWLAMIKCGWAPSSMALPGQGFVSGVEGISKM